jgi:hypothetical protein
MTLTNAINARYPLLQQLPGLDLSTALRRLAAKASLKPAAELYTSSTCFRSPGWADRDEHRGYLEETEMTWKPQDKVEMEKMRRLYRLPQTPTHIAESMQASLSFLDLAPPRISVPLWSAVWLAPLRQLFFPSFSIWVLGEPNTHKSSLTSLMMNHYGEEFDEQHLPASFDETNKHLKYKAFAVKNAILAIGDFTPHNGRCTRRKYSEAAISLIRSAVLMSSHGPNSLIVMNGTCLPEGDSNLARLFIVEVERGDVNQERLERLRQQRERLPHAMAGYMAWITENRKELDAPLKKQWYDYREQAYREGQHLRISESVANLRIGYERGLDFALQCGAIDQQDHAARLEAGINALLECAQRTSDYVNVESEQ